MKKIILTAAALFCITCVNAQADTSGRSRGEQNTSEIPNVMYKYSDHGNGDQDGTVKSDTVRHNKNNKKQRTTTTTTTTTTTNGAGTSQKKTKETNTSAPQK